jgi:hypothetical protein
MELLKRSISVITIISFSTFITFTSYVNVYASNVSQDVYDEKSVDFSTIDGVEDEEISEILDTIKEPLKTEVPSDIIGKTKIDEVLSVDTESKLDTQGELKFDDILKDKLGINKDENIVSDKSLAEDKSKDKTEDKNVYKTTEGNKKENDVKKSVAEDKEEDTNNMYVNVWSAGGSLYIREESNADSAILGTLYANDEVEILGNIATDNNFVEIKYQDDDNKVITGYVKSKYLSEDEVDDTTEKVSEPVSVVATSNKTSSSTGNNGSYTEPKGNSKFNRKSGVVYDSGYRLSYYNLNMKRCVANMRKKGYTAETWVSDKGYKMLGNYIMAAGDYPKGTILHLSIGDIMVVDSGSFIYTYGKSALDICTTW